MPVAISRSWFLENHSAGMRTVVQGRRPRVRSRKGRLQERGLRGLRVQDDPARQPEHGARQVLPREGLPTADRRADVGLDRVLEVALTTAVDGGRWRSMAVDGRRISACVLSRRARSSIPRRISPRTTTLVNICSGGRAWNHAVTGAAALRPRFNSETTFVSMRKFTDQRRVGD